LNITATDTGYTTIKITGGDGTENEDSNISFNVFLYSADPEIESQMGNPAVRDNREYVSSWFGTFRDYYEFPMIRHFNHGPIELLGLDPEKPLKLFFQPEEEEEEPDPTTTDPTVEEP